MSAPDSKPEIESVEWAGRMIKRLRTMRTSYKGIRLRRATVKRQGVCVHTMGSGIQKHMDMWKWLAWEVFCHFYSLIGMGHPHFSIDSDGTIYQITNTGLIAVHCGAQPWMRTAMLDGSWRKKVHAKGLRHWDARWPGRKSPQHLFKGSSGNAAFFGIELKPGPGGLFTEEQYRACAWLIYALSVMEPFDLDSAIAIVGHEDLIPFDTDEKGRWNENGGWDPGALQDKPKFLHAKLRQYVQELRTAAGAQS